MYATIALSWVKLPQYKNPEKELLIRLDLIEQVVEVSGGCKIQLTGGELLFTSADLETVNQFLILYRDVLLSDKE